MDFKDSQDCNNNTVASSFCCQCTANFNGFKACYHAGPCQLCLKHNQESLFRNMPPSPDSIPLPFISPLPGNILVSDKDRIMLELLEEMRQINAKVGSILSIFNISDNLKK